MPEKNPYESQETLDIPDFVEKKKEIQDSVDMNVFKLEDEDKADNYVEEEEEEEERPVRRGGRRVKNNIVMAGGILMALMAVLLIISLIIAGNQRSALKKKQAEYDELQTKMSTMQAQYEAQIQDLKKQIEDLSKPSTPTPSGGSTTPANGTRYVVTASNGINLRAKASVESDLVGSVDNGAEVVIIGDLVKDDEGRQWGKIDDNTWICLINGEEVYAEVIQ